MKVLLTGCNGQLGRCFQDIFPSEWKLIATDSNELDITEQLAVESFILSYKPDIVVNAAAYTAVDKAEIEKEQAEKINIQGPYNLAIASNLIGARFFHVSTDYVFDGTQDKPYKETDKTNPLGVYGKTKLKGEQLVIESNINSVIIRTAWVFSEYGSNFVKTMLKLAKEHKELNIIDDQIGCPTYAGNLATCIIMSIKEKIEAGVYHYCGNEIMSWYDFANKIFNIAKEIGYIDTIPVVRPILSSEYPSIVKRPQYSVLDCHKMSFNNINYIELDESLKLILKSLSYQNN